MRGGNEYDAIEIAMGDETVGGCISYNRPAINVERVLLFTAAGETGWTAGGPKGLIDKGIVAEEHQAEGGADPYPACGGAAFLGVGIVGAP